MRHPRLMCHLRAFGVPQGIFAVQSDQFGGVVVACMMAIAGAISITKD
jgi:hypothetical protein